MLTLSRRTHEAIVLDLPDGRRIRLAVLEVLGKKVRLGLDAPRDVKIMREELLVQQREEAQS